MPYDKKSFLAGVALGRQLKGWATGGALPGPTPQPGILPEIVAAGLVRYYDAARNDGVSYNRTVSTWKDLAGYRDGVISQATWSTTYKSLVFTGGLSQRVASELILSFLPITLEACFTFDRTTYLYPPFWYNVWGCASWYNGPTGGGIEVPTDNNKGFLSVGCALRKNSSWDWYNSNTRFQGTVNSIYHVALTVTTEITLTQYIQGTKVWSELFSGFEPVMYSPMYIGANPDESGRVHSGNVFSVRAYNRVLSDAEIVNNAQHDLLVYSAGLEPAPWNSLYI